MALESYKLHNPGCKYYRWRDHDCDCPVWIPGAAQALGKLGGSVKSKAKIRASRENGKKGGRPKITKPSEE